MSVSSVSLSLCLSVSASLSVCVSLSLRLCLCDCLSVCLCVCLSSSLRLNLSTVLRLFVSTSLHISVPFCLTPPPSLLFQLATSVCAITKAERFNNGVPVSNGLYDPRLGVTDYRVRCRTCENTYSGSGKVNDCPGHHGHMELAAPMYHLGFMNELYKIMQCICFNCSRLLNQDPAVHEIIMLEKGKNRLKAAMKYCKGKKCGDGGLDAGGCNFVQPKFKVRVCVHSGRAVFFR